MNPVKHEAVVPVGVVGAKGHHAAPIPGPRNEPQGAEPDQQANSQHPDDADEEQPRCSNEAGGSAGLLPELRLEVALLNLSPTTQPISAPDLYTRPEDARPLKMIK